MLYDGGDISDIDYQIYLKWFDEFMEEVPIAGVIYLYTDLETCYERILSRNRKGEHVTLKYLQLCSDYHDQWLKSSSMLFLK